MRLHKNVLPLALLLMLPSCQAKTADVIQNQGIAKNQLTFPSKDKTSDNFNVGLSEETYLSYTAFTKKFVSLVMENYQGEEESLGISIPDAYICFAITGAISTDRAREDILSFLELSSYDELKTAVKEIVTNFGTLFIGKDGKRRGGYNLNSLWFNPGKVTLLERDEELYKDLEEVFDASCYYEGLTSEKANQYIKDYGLKDLPAPEISLPDDPAAISAMSVFYCMDFFENSETHKARYEMNKDLMDYTYQGQTTSVHTIQQISENEVYQGEGYTGSRMRIGSSLGMTAFLPDDKDALPSSILPSVLNEEYKPKEYETKNWEGENYTTTNYLVDMKAPYFKLDNSFTLTREQLEKVLPYITHAGAGERMAKAELDLFIDALHQFSIMKFNYDGFYSCSATIIDMETESAPYQSFEEYQFYLDHPYVFQIDKYVSTKNKYKRVPIVVGEIVTPTYID